MVHADKHAGSVRLRYNPLEQVAKVERSAGLTQKMFRDMGTKPNWHQDTKERQWAVDEAADLMALLVAIGPKDPKLLGDVAIKLEGVIHLIRELVGVLTCHNIHVGNLATHLQEYDRQLANSRSNS